jgi:hypothetical protein
MNVLGGLGVEVVMLDRIRFWSVLSSALDSRLCCNL